MKTRIDLLTALACVEGILFSCLSFFVAIPQWLHVIVATLTVVALAATVSTIIQTRKASYNEETSKYDYKFPVVAFVVGTLLLAGITFILALVFNRLYGFALIPFVILLLAILVIAILKHINVLKIVVAILIALMVIALITYSTAWMVKNEVNLNPGLKTDVPAEEQLPNADNGTTDDDNNGVTDDTNNGATDDTNNGATGDTNNGATGDTNNGVTDDTNNGATGDTNNGATDDTNNGATDDTNNGATGDTNNGATDNPSNDVKIIAPEKVKFMQPITVKLEGCKFDELSISAYDYLSIVKKSDYEFEVTVIGIPVDGEIERLPIGSGTFVISHADSGVSVEIEVVE